jgi:hypothetical protein
MPDSTGFSGKNPTPLILLRLFYNYSDDSMLFKRQGETGNQRSENWALITASATFGHSE